MACPLEHWGTRRLRLAGRHYDEPNPTAFTFPPFTPQDSAPFSSPFQVSVYVGWIYHAGPLKEVAHFFTTFTHGVGAKLFWHRYRWLAHSRRMTDDESEQYNSQTLHETSYFLPASGGVPGSALGTPAPESVDEKVGSIANWE